MVLHLRRKFCLGLMGTSDVDENGSPQSPRVTDPDASAGLPMTGDDGGEPNNESWSSLSSARPFGPIARFVRVGITSLPSNN